MGQSTNLIMISGNKLENHS